MEVDVRREGGVGDLFKEIPGKGDGLDDGVGVVEEVDGAVAAADGLAVDGAVPVDEDVFPLVVLHPEVEGVFEGAIPDEVAVCPHD